MRNYVKILFAAILLTVTAGCGSASPKFSDSILFSINAGASGYGTRAECTDAEIIVYTDRSVKIFMVEADYSTIAEIGSVTLSEEDYEKLNALVDRKKLYKLSVKSDESVCDGSNYSITLYDENDEILVSKGGYMPTSKKFTSLYKNIKEILAAYDINQIVDAHREILSVE